MPKGLVTVIDIDETESLEEQGEVVFVKTMVEESCEDAWSLPNSSKFLGPNFKKSENLYNVKEKEFIKGGLGEKSGKEDESLEEDESGKEFESLEEDESGKEIESGVEDESDEMGQVSESEKSVESGEEIESGEEGQEDEVEESGKGGQEDESGEESKNEESGEIGEEDEDGEKDSLASSQKKSYNHDDKNDVIQLEFVDNEDFISLGFVEEEEEDKNAKAGDSNKVTNRKSPAVSLEDDRCKIVSVSSLIHPQTPWWNPAQDQKHRNKHVILRLHEEIRSFCSMISPKPEERFARNQVVQRIEAVAKSIFPDATTTIFGSFDTELYLPSSDIDLVIFTMAPGRDALLLKRVAKRLQRNGIVASDSMQVIANARVPIIKFRDSKYGFQVDVSINKDSGVESAAVIKTMLSKFPALRPMVYLLKQFLLVRSLNEVFSGGLGSYSLMLSITSFLQMHPMLQLGLEADLNLGVLLVEYFELYGLYFRYDRVGIRVSDGGEYYPKENGQQNYHHHLHYQHQTQFTLEDPQNPENDVAKGSFQYKLVRQAFEHAYRMLTRYFQDSLASSRNSNNNSNDHRYHSLNKRSLYHQGGGSILSLLLHVEDSVLEHRNQVILAVQQEYGDLVVKTADAKPIIKEDKVFVFKAGSQKESILDNDSNSHTKNGTSSKNKRKRKGKKNINNNDKSLNRNKSLSNNSSSSSSSSSSSNIHKSNNDGNKYWPGNSKNQKIHKRDDSDDDEDEKYVRESFKIRDEIMDSEDDNIERFDNLNQGKRTMQLWKRQKLD